MNLKEELNEVFEKLFKQDNLTIEFEKKTCFLYCNKRAYHSACIVTDKKTATDELIIDEWKRECYESDPLAYIEDDMASSFDPYLCCIHLPATLLKDLWLDYSISHKIPKTLKKDFSKFKIVARRTILDYVMWCVERMLITEIAEPRCRRYIDGKFVEINIKNMKITIKEKDATIEKDLPTEFKFTIEKENDGKIKIEDGKTICYQKRTAINMHPYHVYNVMFEQIVQNKLI